MELRDYEQITRSRYQNLEHARKYHELHHEGLAWARFTMSREKQIVRDFLKRLRLDRNSVIADIPCGTGVLATVLKAFPARIIASDISLEMMWLARESYAVVNQHYAFVRSDITRTNFATGSVDCPIVIGFLHRVPAEIREETLRELHRISKRYVICTCSIDSPLQWFKQAILRAVRPGHLGSPSPATNDELLALFHTSGFKLLAAKSPIPLLSADRVFLLEKQ